MFAPIDYTNLRESYKSIGNPLGVGLDNATKLGQIQLTGQSIAGNQIKLDDLVAAEEEKKTLLEKKKLTHCQYMTINVWQY